MVWMYLYVYVSTYRMTHGKLEVRIFILFKRTKSLPVEVINRMLILLNYRLKHLKRRWYTYTFYVNALTHVNTLSWFIKFILLD